MTKNVLILCTGNSCRSIMAEAILRTKGRGRYAAFSAGSKPAGAVNPRALALLKSKGFDVSGLRSKSWDEFSAHWAPPMDFVITVCSNAAGETCPLWIGAPLAAHWGIADPANATGDAAAIEAAFQQAHDRLEARIDAFLALDLDALSLSECKAALHKIGQMEGAE